MATIHGMYISYDAGFPLGTGDLDDYASDNNLVIRYGHEFGDSTQWSFFETGTNFTHWNSWVGVDTVNRRFTYSCPLLADTNAGDYAGLVAGTYDSHFTNLGNAFQAQPNLRNAIVRLGWEFNGVTFSWAIPANASNAQVQSYKDGYNRAASLMKAQCPTLEFEWCPNGQLDNANRTLADMYPGNTYVDYIGAALYDYYWPGGTPSDAVRFAWIQESVNGLNDQAALAEAQGKPMAYTEWGLWTTADTSGGGDHPAFITFALDWFVQNDVHHSIYNNTGPGHQLDLYPTAKAVYIGRFSTGELAPSLGGYGHGLYGVGIYGYDVSITVTPDNTFAQNQITVNNVGFYSTLTITRIVDGFESVVRGGTNVNVNGLSSFVVLDYEAPLDVPVTYRASFDSGFSVTSAASTIVTDGVTFWLKDVILGAFSTKVKVEEMDPVVRPANVLGTFKVLNRKNPIIVTDVRQGRTGTMTLSAVTPQDSKNITNILDSGNTLLFQAPGNAQFPDMYFQAGDVTETWRGVSSNPVHSWQIPFTETDMPSGTALTLASNSWLLVAQFQSWDDVKNRRLTWKDVLLTPFSDLDTL